MKKQNNLYIYKWLLAIKTLGDPPSVVEWHVASAPPLSLSPLKKETQTPTPLHAALSSSLIPLPSPPPSLYANSPSPLCNFRVLNCVQSRKHRMLHHSTISSSEEQSSLPTLDEIHVAQILLHIATTIRTLEYGSGGLKWGRKKRRSRSDEPYQKNDVEQENRPPPPPTASPVTPLCFAPSESDDHKSKHLSKKTSKNKVR